MAIMKVIGASRHQGEVESSKIKFDFTRVYTVGRQDSSTGTRAGYAGVDLRALPHVYQQVMDLPFTPEGVECEVTIEQMATGKGEFKDTVTDIRVIKPASALPTNSSKAA